VRAHQWDSARPAGPEHRVRHLAGVLLNRKLELDHEITKEPLNALPSVGSELRHLEGPESPSIRPDAGTRTSGG
jgi:hypothetical protein